MSIHFKAIPRRVYRMDDWEQVLLGRPLKLRDLIDRTSEVYGVLPAEVVGSSRQRRLSRPRQVVMFIAHRLYGFSLPQIAASMGRDHTTILHGVRAIERVMTPELSEAIANIARDVEHVVIHPTRKGEYTCSL